MLGIKQYIDGITCDENDVLSIEIEKAKNKYEAFVKIRYNMDFVKSKIVVVDDGVYIYFSEPVSALTKGQACVIYDVKDKHLLGGGII